MKLAGKWIFILSTIFCSAVIFSSIIELNIGRGRAPAGDVPIGAGAGIFLWFFLWFATALPGLFIYWIAGRAEKKKSAAKKRVEAKPTH